MTEADVQSLVAFCERTAHEAGAIHLEHFESLAGEEITRKGEIDLVTVADERAEALIAERIRGAYPDHELVAEETAPGDAAAFTPGVPRWYVDPLDGTTNFVQGFPLFAVSIACWLDGEPLAGCVHAPYMRETFTAGRGRGAWLGERRLRVSQKSALSESVLATGFCYDRKTIVANNVRNFGNFILDVRGIRRGGASALDLAYVAAGRLDGYWEPYLSPWDIAAGILLVREAGGVVTDFRGGPVALDGRALVASGPALAAPIREKLVEGPGIS